MKTLSDPKVGEIAYLRVDGLLFQVKIVGAQIRSGGLSYQVESMTGSGRFWVDPACLQTLEGVEVGK